MVTPSDEALPAPMLTADDIRWTPSWAYEQPIDRANLLALDDVELLAYAADLQRGYRSLRDLWSVAVDQVRDLTKELDVAREHLHAVRVQYRALRVQVMEKATAA